MRFRPSTVVDEVCASASHSVMAARDTPRILRRSLLYVSERAAVASEHARCYACESRDWDTNPARPIGGLVNDLVGRFFDQKEIKERSADDILVPIRGIPVSAKQRCRSAVAELRGKSIAPR